jgi:integrase
MANVTLRQKKIANNKSSLYLDYFPPIINPKTANETRREFLKLKIFDHPTNLLEKEHNKTTIEFANLIRAKRLTQLKDREYGFKENIEINVNFLDYYETIVAEYYNKGSKSNYMAWRASFGYFKKFIGSKVSSKNLTPVVIKKYREFLLNTPNLRTNNGKIAVNTASTYYKHFLFVLKRAFIDQIIPTNLAEHALHIKEEETFREYLTEDELVKLWNTEIKFPQIKRAALFSALTGFRFIDIKNLNWNFVLGDKHQGYYVRLKEQKTGNIHNHPISLNAYEILQQENTTTGTVFNGLNYQKTHTTVKTWVKASGIQKKISFHNFRHSYATLQLANGTDIYIVSKLLGHKNVATTQIYTKVLDKNKIEAANRINLDLDGLSK